MEKYSDLGTDEIHKRHSILVETIDNKVSRSKVMDQAIIDRYLIQGVITLSQHQSADQAYMQRPRTGIIRHSVAYQREFPEAYLHLEIF